MTDNYALRSNYQSSIISSLAMVQAPLFDAFVNYYLLTGLSNLPPPPSSEAVGASCDPTTLR